MNAFYEQLHNTSLSLSDYLQAVKLTISEIFSHEVWVQAEIRAVNSKGGHYYFELAQTDDNDTVIASCRGTLWRFKAGSIISKFEQATGTPLKAGLLVLIKGQASFHAQYGFSFNISDIDPNYTLGELAAAYNAMKNKLSENGLLTANKTIALPFDLQKIAVIAPENAAGLGDFRAEADILANCGACQFSYYHATFQGNHAPSEIREAIGRAMTDFANHNSLPDLLIIIRGGGAVGDLAYLNDYELAAMIGESPVPVWVGIGHEKDQVILDEVAHTRFDTPSKVIAGVRDFLANRWGNAQSYFDDTRVYASRIIDKARHEQARTVEQIKTASIYIIERHKMVVKGELFAVQKNSEHHILTAKSNVRQLQTEILNYNPTNILAKGYAIVKKDNTIIHGVADIQQGDTLQLVLKDGQISTTVTQITKDNLKE